MSEGPEPHGPECLIMALTRPASKLKTWAE